jgi:hypothetical protein
MASSDKPLGRLRPADVLRLTEELRDRYRGRNNRILDWRKIRRDEVTINLPPAYRTTATEVKLALPRVWVRRAVGILASRPFKVRVSPPPEAGDTELLATSRREKFMMAGWKQMERQQRSSLFRNIVDHAVGDGQAWIKLVHKPSAWQGLPEVNKIFAGKDSVYDLEPGELDEYTRRLRAWKRSAPWPFAIRTPDPTTVFPVWGEFGLDAVIEESRRPFRDVQRWVTKVGGVPLSIDDVQEPAEVSITEYWDPWVQQVFVNLSGTLVEVVSRQHGYGFIPYFFAPGWEESTSIPEEKHLSVLLPLEGTIQAIYTTMTAKLNRAYLASFPTWQTDGFVGSEDSADPSPKPFELEIGKVHPLEPGSDKGIFPVALPPFTDDLEEIFGALSSISESSQVDPAAIGGDAFSGESGFFRSLRAEMARVPFDQIGDNVASALSQCFQRMLELVDIRVRDSISVKYADKGSQEWVTLGPDDIDGNYDIDVLISTADPINDIAKQNHFANMRDRKFVSHRTALEMAGFEDPEEEQDLLAFEEIMDSPLGKQWTLEHMFARMGQSVSPEQAQEATQAVLQGGGVDPAIGGQFGGRPPGQQQVPGLGAPTVGPANQPGPGQVPVGR